MKISYLPIFLAVTTCLVFGTSAQHTRVLRDIDVLSSLSDTASLMSTLASMMMPSEVLSMLTSEFQQIFSNMPGMKFFNGLNPMANAGRKRRAIYPWASHVKNTLNKEVNNDKYFALRLPEYSGSLSTGKKAENVPVSFFPGQAESRHFTRSVATELQEVSAADEGGSMGADMVSKGMEMAQNGAGGSMGADMVSKGMEMAQNGPGGSMGADMATKGIEMAQTAAEGMGSVMKGGEMMGKMASNAASAGQQMAQAAGKGAEVMSKGGEVFQTGAAQASEMATSFGRK